MNNPFTPESAIAKVFDMAAKGTTRDAINKLAAKLEVNAPRLFHCLRRGEYADVKWAYQQDEAGAVKIVAKGKPPVAKKVAAKHAVAKKVKSQEKASELVAA